MKYLWLVIGIVLMFVGGFIVGSNMFNGVYWQGIVFGLLTWIVGNIMAYDELDNLLGKRS